MKKFILPLLIFSLIYVISLPAEVINEKEELLFKQMLKQGNFAQNSLNFLKDWADDTKYKLPVVVKILNNPLYFAEFVEMVEANSKKSPKQILDFYSKNVFQTEIDVSKEEREFEDFFTKNSYNAEVIFDYVEKVFEWAERDFSKGFDSLSAQELEKLKYFSYSIWSEQEDSLKYDKFSRKMKLKNMRI